MMKVFFCKSYIALLVCLMSIVTFNLYGQIGISLFSYTELFHAPNESYRGQKSYETGYNKVNLSFQNFGASISYGINKKFRAELVIQKVSRQFDCDCIDALITKDVFYFVSTIKCPLKLRATDNILQIPLSLSYVFLQQNQKISHSVGVGNTLIYSLGRKNLIFDDSFSVEQEFLPSFISIISPEIYYRTDVNITSNLLFNFVLGFRKEPLISSNYAIYGKIGLSYVFNK